MDLFSTIPPSILLEILQILPDFLSSQALLHASPAVSRIFEECGHEIVDSIATQTLSPTNCRLLQRTKHLLRQNWYIEHDTNIKLQPMIKTDDKYYSTPILRRLVRTASYIQYFSCSSLNKDRLVGHNLYAFSQMVSIPPKGVQLYDSKLSGPPYELKDIKYKYDYWLKRHDLLGALWHIQIHRIKTAR